MSNSNFVLLFFFLISVVLLEAQIDPLAEIQGRLSIYLDFDTTSMHIGKNAGANQSGGQKMNTFVGTNAGLNNDGGFFNSFYGSNAGRDMRTQVVGMFDASVNSFFGTGAGQSTQYGSANCFFGALAGNENIGRPLLNIPDGDGNSFFGYESGRKNERGSHNSFFGYRSGSINTGRTVHPVSGDTSIVGSENAFFGSQAGRFNTTGERNVFLGASAGYHNIGGEIEFDGELYLYNGKGDKNCFLGHSAGYENEYGSNNSALGFESLRDNLEGNANVALGYRAGVQVEGNRNVFIGNEAGPNNNNSAKDTFSNRLYIHSNFTSDPLIYGEFDNRLLGINTGNPEMTLHIGGQGNESRLLFNNAGDIFFKNSNGDNKAILTLHSDDDTYLDAFDDLKFRSGHNLSQANPDMILQGDGDVGIGVSDPIYKLHVDGSVRGTDIICTSTSLCSDIRFKKNFSAISDPMNIISQLNGYYHQWRTDEFPKWQFSEGREIGFKAQEIQKVLPEVVEEMSDGYLAVDYSKVVPLLVEAIKDLQAQIEQQKLDHQQLQSELAQIISDKSRDNSSYAP
ncbi:MAG: tail fiber domain-containing protein [Saprospiraceae bacterium]|nr:tail fiber domain-containing protein [Saprospiraceae bacterium]